MSDLFGPVLLAGLAFAPELVTPGEEARLISEIEAAGLTPFQFGQFEGKRLTRSFGAHYDFASHRLREAEPIPPWLEPIRERAAAFASLAPYELRHALLIRYDPGSGIGWHKDRPVFDRVIGISLGNAAVLAFRRRRENRGFERYRLPLPPRSAYLLSGEARHGWEHGISAHDALRYSLTFRSIAPRGLPPIGNTG
jgi:hypothetical protein